MYVHNTNTVLEDVSDEPNLHNESSDGAQGMLANPNRTSDRLDAIEARLEQIAAGLGYVKTTCDVDLFGHYLMTDRSRNAEQSPLARPVPQRQVMLGIAALDLAPGTVSNGILLYFTNHCNQPYPLLDHLKKEPLANQYAPIVLNAMLALTLRRSGQEDLALLGGAVQISDLLARRCWELLVDAYSRFEFDESYFQALCLLAQVDHGEGRLTRAQVQVALGLRLVQAQGMLDKAHYEFEVGTNYQRHQEIVWSLFILDRVLNFPHPSIPQSLYKLPAYQGGPSHPDHYSDAYNAATTTNSAQNFKIVDSFVHMIRMWERVNQYISKDLSIDSHPIWHHKSARTAILTHLLELEIREYLITQPRNSSLTASSHGTKHIRICRSRQPSQL